MKEIWKVIPGFTYYEASNLGRVRRSKNKLILKANSNEKGYQRVQLGDGLGNLKNMMVHRLVLWAFTGILPKLSCAHGDGNPSNNRLDNLRWATATENGADMVRHGRSHVGEKHPQVKISEADAKEIIRRYKRTAHRESNWKVLAEEFGLSQAQINGIASGRSWKHLSREVIK